MPNRADLQRALGLMKRRADYEYFFSRLTSPDWITPIDEEGLFSRPPEAERQGEYIQFPFWPESDYLARVAGDAPVLAGRVLRQISTTDNQRVHHDLVSVALKVSDRDAAAWADTEAEWLTAQTWLGLLVPQRLAELIEKLSRGGYENEAFRLTRALLDLRPDARVAAVQKGEFQFPPDPQAKFDAWEYGNVLARLVPALTTAFKLNAFRLFADLLGRALELSQSERRGPPVDYSFIWRHEIEHNDPKDGDIKNLLVTATRDSAERCAAAGECREVIVELEARAWDVCRRLALHTIRTSCVNDPELAKGRVLSRAAFDDPAIRHEYAMLQRDVFADLTSAEQAEVLEWIRAGQNRERIRERHQATRGEQLSPELELAWVEQWQRDRLSPIKDSLPAPWRAIFDDFVDRHGPPDFDFHIRTQTAVAWGARSPVSVENMKSLDADGIRRFLSEWIPEGDDPRSPSRDGVVQTLQALGDAFFEGEAATAEMWRDLHPVYIAAFLAALVRSIRAGRQISWVAVLRLAESLLSREGEDWDSVWLKRCIADLIIAGFDAEPSSRLPREENAMAFRLVERLLSTSGQEPSAFHLAAEADSLTAAINSLPGKALEAAIRYGVWVKRDSANSGADWSLGNNLAVLDRLLATWVDPRSNQFVDARAMFGLHLGALLWLDRKWVEQHLSDLFPVDAMRIREWGAVWNTYLVYGAAFIQTFDLLRLQYIRSIESLVDTAPGTGRRRDVRSRLAEHLMVHYWQGSLSRGDADRLLEHFFERADVSLRSHAIDFIGRSLPRDDEDVPQEHVSRLVTLIEWRVSEVSAITDRPKRKERAQEVSSFGWWFASAKFDAPWSLVMLISVLRLGGNVEPDHMIAERLLELVDDHPAGVAEALFLMIEAPREHYTVASWRDEARALLGRLLSQDDSAVRQRARDTVDALLTRGFREFRDLSQIAAPPTR